MCLNIFSPSFALQEGSESKKRSHSPDSNDRDNKRFRSDLVESRLAAEKGLDQWLINLENPDSIPGCIECAQKGKIDALGALLLSGKKLLQLQKKHTVLGFCCVAARNNEGIKKRLAQFADKVVLNLENADPHQKNLANFYAGILSTFDVVWPKDLNDAIFYLAESQDAEAQDLIRRIESFNNDLALKSINMLMAVTSDMWSEIFKYARAHQQMRLVCKCFCDVVDSSIVNVKSSQFDESVAPKCNNLINLRNLTISFKTYDKNSLASRQQFEAAFLWEKFLKENTNISMLKINFPDKEYIFSQLTCKIMAKGLEVNNNLQHLRLCNCNVFALKDIAESLKKNIRLQSLEILRDYSYDLEAHVDIRINKFDDNAGHKKAHDFFGLFINFTAINDKIFLLFHTKNKGNNDYEYFSDTEEASPLTPDSQIGKTENGRLILICKSPNYTEQDPEGTDFNTYEAGVHLADLREAGINIEHFTQLLDKPGITSLSLVHPLMKLFDHHWEIRESRKEYQKILDSMVNATIVFSENIGDNITFKNFIIGREKMLNEFKDEYYIYNDEYILQFFGYTPEVIWKYMNAIEKLNSKGITVK